MLRVRPDLLPALRCGLCGGYLSCTPVVLQDERQLCGRCFRLLPPPEQGQCVRQVAYEAVAEMLLFPCRYGAQGCTREFPLNAADGHELECPFRYRAIGDAEDGQGHAPWDRKWGAPTPGLAVPAPWASFAALDVSECISVQGRHALKEGQATPSALKYEIDVAGNEARGATLCLRSSPRNYSNIAGHLKNNPLRISVRGTLALPTFQNIFCEVLVTPESDPPNPNEAPSEPVYETIGGLRSGSYPKCTKCAHQVQAEIYHCFFGHDVCRSCKGSTCVLCTSPMSATPRFCCRNFAKGCHVYLLQAELHLHAQDCEFAERGCLLGCGESCESLAALKEHLKEKHLQGIFMSNAVVRQAAAGDEAWVMVAFDSVFQCKKYAYDGDMEFLVEYVGPHEKASGFKYEVLVKLENEVKITKAGICRSWNFSALDRALVVTESELSKCKIKKKTFNYTLNIVQILKD